MSFKRSEINKIVMDYLVAEGFKEAAEKFKLEAGIEISRLNNDALSETDEQLDQRIEIRAAIEEGNISGALWLINQHYPELIDHNRCLFFKLQVGVRLFVYILRGFVYVRIRSRIIAILERQRPNHIDL